MTTTQPTPAIGPSTNLTAYSLGAFTPTAGEFLVLMVFASDTLSKGFVTGGDMIWTPQLYTTAAADSLYIFWARTLASPVSATITFNCPDDAATGCGMTIFSTTGCDVTTRNPIRQSVSNSGNSTNATGTFATAMNTNNSYLACWAGGLAAGASAPPTNWTEGSDRGYANPSRNFATAFRNGGDTGTTVTFGNATTPWLFAACEMYASGAGTVLIAQLAMTGVG